MNQYPLSAKRESPRTLSLRAQRSNLRVPIDGDCFARLAMTAELDVPRFNESGYQAGHIGIIPLAFRHTGP